METRWIRVGLAAVTLAGFGGAWRYIQPADDATAPDSGAVVMADAVDDAAGEGLATAATPATAAAQATTSGAGGASSTPAPATSTAAAATATPAAATRETATAAATRSAKKSAGS